MYDLPLLGDDGITFEKLILPLIKWDIARMTDDLNIRRCCQCIGVSIMFHENVPFLLLDAGYSYWKIRYNKVTDYILLFILPHFPLPQGVVIFFHATRTYMSHIPFAPHKQTSISTGNAILPSHYRNALKP